MKILEELWNGNILPSERNIGVGGKMQHLGALIVRHEKALDPLLSEEAKGLLEKLQDNQAEWAYLKECEIFTYGFRLGARIMLEVMDDSDKMAAVPHFDLKREHAGTLCRSAAQCAAR